MHLQGRQFQFA